MEKTKVKKPKSSKKTKEKTNLQKRDQIVLVSIIAIIIIAIIIVLVVVNKNKSKEPEENATVAQTTTTTTTSENVKVQADGTKENVSSKLKEEKKFEGMKVKDIKLKSQSDLTNFTATVENTTDKDFTGKPIVITFTNKSGETVSTLEGYLGDTKKGETSIIDASATTDLSDAYDFSIKVK